jgi:hypothetical protein
MPQDDTRALNERQAQLDAEIRAELTRLKELLAAEQALRIQIAECRVRFGNLLEERLSITPYGQKVCYVKQMAMEHGFRPSKAYDNRYFAYLHRDHGYTFARLAILSVQEVRAEAGRLSRSAHGNSISEQRNADAIANTVAIAVSDYRRLPQLWRRERLEWIRGGWSKSIYEAWMAASISLPRTALSDEERGRGLSNLMIDSGAFSVANLGGAIDIDDYCQFLINNPWLTSYINLDEINHDLPEEAALISWRRFQYMREYNLDPIPVFHAGEGFDWLRKYLDLGCERIGLGGVAGSRSLAQNWAFFDQCFKIIQACGFPVSVHALGIAVPATLLHYPFASADASPWALKSQRYERTDLSRLGGAGWVASLTYYQKLAAGTYLEVLDANRLEREVREQRPFDFYLVFRLSNRWVLPAFRLVGHRNALISFYAMSANEHVILRRFVEDPRSVIDGEQRFAEAEEMLNEMKTRYANVRMGVRGSMRRRFRRGN